MPTLNTLFPANAPQDREYTLHADGSRTVNFLSRSWTVRPDGRLYVSQVSNVPGGALVRSAADLAVIDPLLAPVLNESVES